MKTTYFYQLLFSLFISTSVFAAESTSVKEPIIISGTKFTYPLIEKWIAEHPKVNPNSKLKIAPKLAAGQTADLSIIAHQPAKDELKADQAIVYAGKYALLPVTNQ